MNNFMISLKKFFKNKNTVTVLGVIIVLVVLYWGYSSAVNKATAPVTVPVASNRIDPYTKITKDDIEFRKVPGITVEDNVIRKQTEIVGNYTNLNVTIPEGSMFYTEWIVTEDELPGKWIEKVNFEEGEEAFYLNVDSVSTMGNSVIVNSYIDIYMRAYNEVGLIQYGKLLENIKVLAVHDSTGNNVFDGDKTATNYLGFAVTQEYYLLLRKAQYLEDLGVELVIAPHGTAVGELGDVAVRSQELRDYIIAQTAQIDTDILLSQPEEVPAETVTE